MYGKLKKLNKKYFMFKTNMLYYIVLDSEQSDKCINFTMMYDFTYLSSISASIFSCRGGFLYKSGSRWYFNQSKVKNLH